MKLIIFDVDGTLADRETSQLLPGVREWFATHNDGTQFAIATNQGGVGLKHWMTSGGFGDPAKLPDESAVRAHITQVIQQLKPCAFRVYMCFAYQSMKTGKWSPTPEGQERSPEWNSENRKPKPGMLKRAMQAVDATPEETLFVGNDIEDIQAATKAGVKFVYAKDFFNV